MGSKPSAPPPEKRPPQAETSQRKIEYTCPPIVTPSESEIAALKEEEEALLILQQKLKECMKKRDDLRLILCADNQTLSELRHETSLLRAELDGLHETCANSLRCAEEDAQMLVVYRQSYDSDVSALGLMNKELRQEWNDCGSALFDMQNVVVNATLCSNPH